MSRRRLPKPRLLSVEERKELDELIAEQEGDDRSWVTSSRYAMSLDALLSSDAEGGVSLKDLMVEVPDFTPFGFLRRLMEQEDFVQRRFARRRRTIGWRVTRKDAPTGRVAER